MHDARPGAPGRRFLAYGIALSILAHLLFAPFARGPKTIASADVPAGRLRIIHATPQPRLAPTPPPKARVVLVPPRAVPSYPHGIAVRLAPRKRGHAEISHGGVGALVAANDPGANSGDGPLSALPPEPEQIVAPRDLPTIVPAAVVVPPLPVTPPPATCAHPNLQPRTIAAFPPETPPLAREEGIAGTVFVEVQLDAESHIVNVIVRDGPSALRGAALAAARQSQFATEVRNCVPLAATYVYVVEFQAQ